MNKKIVWGIVGVIVLVAVFYGGVSYGKGQTASTAKTAFAGRTRGTGGATGATGGLTTGSIVAEDATSITVSLMGGGSKIIFFDTNTKVSKTVAGDATDLAVGDNVLISGTANSDGSMDATTIQIRPAMPATTTPTTPSTTVVQ